MISSLFTSKNISSRTKNIRLLFFAIALIIFGSSEKLMVKSKKEVNNK